MFNKKHKIPSWERIGKTPISDQKGTNPWNAKNGFFTKPFFFRPKTGGLHGFDRKIIPSWEHLGSLFQSFDIILSK